MQNRLRRPRAEINVKPFTAYLYKIGPVGLEPTTYGLEIRCSIQLSYEPDTCLQKAVIIVPRFYRQAGCLQSYEFEQMIECYQFDSFSRNGPMISIIGVSEYALESDKTVGQSTIILNSVQFRGNRSPRGQCNQSE